MFYDEGFGPKETTNCSWLLRFSELWGKVSKGFWADVTGLAALPLAPLWGSGYLLEVQMFCKYMGKSITKLMRSISA